MGNDARRKGGGSVSIQPELFGADPQTQRATMNGKPVFAVPALSVLNLDSGFKHKKLCDGPTFSTGSACAYSCSFCYVEDLMRKNPHWAKVKESNPSAQFEDVVIRRTGAVAALRKQLTFADGRPRFEDPNDNRVIYGSPLVDVAANMELARETVEVCKAILELTHWQIRLLSKSTLMPKVAQMLESESRHSPRQRVIYGVSTGTVNDKLAQAFERGTPLVSKRIAALHWLQDNGFRTYGMICPSLPCDDYNAFAEQSAEAIRADRCEHVWGEVLNARGESFTRTLNALKESGHNREAELFARVSSDKPEWEAYARSTFLAHTKVIGGEKLRFLQYVTAESKPWWAERQNIGAVLL